MARINNKCVVLFVLIVLASGEFCVVSGYRPFSFAFQNRHFPHNVQPSNPKSSSSWTRQLPGASVSPSLIEKQTYDLPSVETRNLLASGSSSSIEVSPSTYIAATAKGPQRVTKPTISNFFAAGRRYSIGKKWLLVAILIPSVLVFLTILIFLIWACKWRSKRSTSMPIWTNQSTLERHLDTELSTESSKSKKLGGPLLNHLQGLQGCINAGGLPTSPCSFPYALLQTATSNFSSSNLLGEGSFAHVYKARLDYGVFAAVKRLTDGGQQGEADFQAEVDLMSKIRHENLVSLLGFSSDGPEHLLVYELMQNGSLHDQLHGPSHGNALTWHLRLKIALEAARGLEHLHEHCKPAVIHRDFKASNILLDASFNAKVSDFGLALAVPDQGSPLEDNVQVQGTFGYVAPEYLMDGTLTEKSDVYAFGVVLLELLTGRLPIDPSMPVGSQSLVTWATLMLTDRGKLLERIDPCLQASVNLKHLHQVAAVAVLCVQSEASYRPLIADVVQSLVPLIPQELGGAWRDPKSLTPSASSKKSPYSKSSFVTDFDLQSHSRGSDRSVRSFEEALPRTTESGVSSHNQSWEGSMKA